MDNSHYLTMDYVRCFLILLNIFSTFQLNQSNEDSDACCWSFNPGNYYDELNIVYEFNTFPVEIGSWELSVNISWTPTSDYDGYDMELELATVKRNSFDCSNRRKPCYTEMESGTWRTFESLQFSSIYKILIYVSKYANNLRGNHLIQFIISPDCIEETLSVEFCRDQDVDTIGKPFNITTNAQRIDRTNDAVVTVTWRQPIHINKDASLKEYLIAWYSDDIGGDRISLPNVTYEPGEYIETELSKPLLGNTNYTLTISPVLIVPDRSDPIIRSEAEIMFNTDLPDLEDIDYPQDSFPSYLTGIIIGVSLLFLMTITTVIGFYRNRNVEFVTRIPDEIGKEATDLIGDLEHLIPREDITWKERILLGSGYYGEVYMCKVQIGCDVIDAAVKLPKQMTIDKGLNDFVEEIKQIIKLGNHENVVRFLGYNTESTPFMLINEYVQYGDMGKFLRKAKKRGPKDDPIYIIELIEQLQLAKQIANGMAYISSKNLFHGDLAARNILIDKGLQAKITDFGLSVDIVGKNYHRLEGQQPWKWLALEALTEHKVSTESDVWSFGIVLTEIFQFCDPCPYDEIKRQEDLIDFLSSQGKNKRMPKPIGCPEDVYQIMLRCWDEQPLLRPTFPELYNEFTELTHLHIVRKAETGEVSNQNQSRTLTETSGSSCGTTEFIRESGSIGIRSNDSKINDRTDLFCCHSQQLTGSYNGYRNLGFCSSIEETESNTTSGESFPSREFVRGSADSSTGTTELLKKTGGCKADYDKQSTESCTITGETSMVAALEESGDSGNDTQEDLKDDNSGNNFSSNAASEEISTGGSLILGELECKSGDSGKDTQESQQQIIDDCVNDSVGGSLVDQQTSSLSTLSEVSFDAFDSGNDMQELLKHVDDSV